ncbi:MAG: hypothetical protein RXR59_05705 [Sulfolobus sp.]
MSSKIAVYANLIIRYENEIKEEERKLADDGKKLVLLSQSLASQLRNVAEQVFTEVSKEIERASDTKGREISQKYQQEREKELLKIKQNGEKNLDKAVDFVLRKVMEVYK